MLMAIMAHWNSNVRTICEGLQGYGIEVIFPGKCYETCSSPFQVIQINFEEFDLELGYDTLTIGDGGEVGDSRTIIQV